MRPECVASGPLEVVGGRDDRDPRQAWGCPDGGGLALLLASRRKPTCPPEGLVPVTRLHTCVPIVHVPLRKTEFCKENCRSRRAKLQTPCLCPPGGMRWIFSPPPSGNRTHQQMEFCCR